MTPTPPLVLPARPQGWVALLILHAQAGEDFVGDTAQAWVAGRLRARGIEAQLIHVHYPRAEPEACRDLDRLLVGALQGCVLAVFDQAWDEDLLAQIAQTGALLCTTDPFGQFRRVRMDLTLRGFQRDRRGLLELCERVVRGGDIGDIAGLSVQLAGMDVPRELTPWQDSAGPPLALLPFDPVTESLIIGAPRNLDGAAPAVRRTLETSIGCPFSDPVANNPLYVGTDLSAPGITLRGCSFCLMGGDYRAAPVAEIIAQSLSQIRYWQAHLPRLDEVILRDQSALRYLPELIHALLASDLRPVGLLVPGRGDAILRWGPQLRRSAQQCDGSLWWFTIHLVGFESFSQSQLDRYNKGVTVQEYARALEEMRELHRQYPESFRLYAHGASSFVLFNPWTTLQELQETVESCDDHAVGALAHGMTLSRLRLYPNLPLYWLAQRDGLLAEAEPATLGLLSAGYSVEAAWRYADPRVALVEDLQRRLGPRVRPDQSVGLLAAVLRAVAERDAAEGPPPAEARAGAAWAAQTIEAQFCDLQRLWRKPLVPAGESRIDQRRTVTAGRHCNQRCATCVAGRAQLDDDVGRLRSAVRDAAAHGQLVLAGREPALLPDLLGLLRTARQAGARDVEVLTNGRFLVTPQAAVRLRAAGATRLAIKRHRLADTDEDAYVAAPGAGAQTDHGIALVREAGLPWAAVLVGTRQAWQELPQLVDWAVDRGAREVRLQILAAELPLGALPAVADALGHARDRAASRGVRLDLDGP